MTDINAPESLRCFQIQYGKYIRNPNENELLDGVPARRSEIYESLLFNNICGFVNNCFPVSKSLFCESEWEQFCRNFFSQWRCETPIFSQIPLEFVSYISTVSQTDDVPAWLPELLHYEWVELEVDLDETELSASEANSVLLNPASRLLSYAWPVHKISNSNRPEEKAETHLVVYRDKAFSVRFTEVNATTMMLLQFIQNNRGDIDEVLRAFAGHIQHPDENAIVAFGKNLIQDFKQTNIIVGDEI